MFAVVEESNGRIYKIYLNREAAEKTAKEYSESEAFEVFKDIHKVVEIDCYYAVWEDEGEFLSQHIGDYVSHDNAAAVEYGKTITKHKIRDDECNDYIEPEWDGHLGCWLG